MKMKTYFKRLRGKIHIIVRIVAAYACLCVSCRNRSNRKPSRECEMHVNIENSTFLMLIHENILFHMSNHRLFDMKR